MKSADLARGAQIAAAALTGLAALAAAGCGGSDGGKDVVVTENPLVCVGGNACQGMSECAGGPGGSECAGMNECTGMGWAYTDSEEECEAAGGHIDDES